MFKYSKILLYFLKNKKKIKYKQLKKKSNLKNY